MEVVPFGRRYHQQRYYVQGAVINQSKHECILSHVTAASITGMDIVKPLLQESQWALRWAVQTNQVLQS